jgi:chromosome segregation protein
MFKLQRLEITGFKSFADYTEIIFTGNGITAVVGPNGCGKSNISDGITWVLGEQRAKNLRGGEMQDVIFAGTKTRPPSGMAEVVLHLVRDDSFFGEDGTDEISDIDEALSDFDERAVDVEDFESNGHHAIESNGNGFHHETNGNGFHHETNGNGHHGVEVAEVAAGETVGKLKTKRQWKPRRAALDFAPGEAVTITRRLYRSGDSEYQLNGRACRLRDIQDLFAGTGLSGGHYALVQQEKISQILSAKPAERRQLIEEAAGITKFRTRQRAAEVRLESAKNNLRRISDIVSEVDKQANSLRRQAARTRRYREMQETLRELLAQVFAAEGLELSNALETLREKLMTAVSEENRLADAVQKQSEAAGNATQAARQAEERLSEVRHTAAENALRRERLSRDFAHQTEQTADLEERISALKHEIKTLTERLTSVSADAERLREKNQQSNTSNETETAALQSAEQDYQKHLAEVRQIEANLEKVRNELMQHTTAVERFREIGKQQANALERLTERAAGLEKEGTRAAATHDEKEAEAVALDAKIKTAREVLIKRKAEKQTALETAQKSREELHTLEKNLNKIRDEVNAVRARRETLEKLDNQKALLAPAVQKLFAVQKQIGVNLRGTLADFLRVEAKYERAVEAVFGANLQTVLVETTEDVDKIAAWLKTARAGTLNLLTGTSDAKPAKRGKSEKIADLLEISDELKDILRGVLPDALDFLVIDDLSESAKFADQNCVTLSGEIMRQNRFFSFGQQGEKQSILSFKRELRELAARAEELKANFESTELTVKNARDVLKTHEEAIANLNSAISFDEREVMSLEMESKSLRQEVERAERHKKVVEDEKVRLQNELKDLTEKQAKAEADGKTAEGARQNASAKLADASASLAEARKCAETANVALSEKRAEAAAAGERRRSLQNALRRVEQEQAETKSRLTARNNDLESNNKKLQQLKDSLAELEAQTFDIEGEKEQEQIAIAEALKTLTAAREQADKLAATLNEANAQAAKAKDARASLEVQQAEIATRLQNLYDTCQHDLNQSLHEVLKTAEITDFKLADGKRKVEDLRSKLEGFGAVNLLALEELNEAEERLLFLTSQRRDIVDGITAAEDALAEIKRRSRERFEHAFAEINRNFTELFSEIFGGGKGEMSLLDAADVLESGVEIVAQPPGKRLQNLLLLSGGEKALTAIALVLAIFRYRPAPFCLLDEVDAPLDEANVGRFIEKVAQMSADIQFIVITHNKRTMEAARALYGVTMEEAGISKLVSVKFE